MAEAKRVTKSVTDTFKAATDTAVEAATEAFQQSAEAFDRQSAETARAGFGFELPAAFRELAEKGLAQAKQNYERAKAAAEGTTELVESTISTAFKGASEYNMKLLETLRANINAQFDFTRDLLGVKSPSEAVELSSAHARKAFEAMTAQTKELASIAQKVSNDTAEPIKAGFNKALRVVA